MKVFRTKSMACISAIVFLSGCAASSGANYRPLIDSKGVDFNKYESDLRECQSYATQTAGAGESAVVGALAGAVFGAVLAGAAGNRYDKKASARVGAVTGAAGGAVEGERDQRTVINRCLAGRGYQVLK
jgi:outer membrane lipoprotein SlyB